MVPLTWNVVISMTVMYVDRLLLEPSPLLELLVLPAYSLEPPFSVMLMTRPVRGDGISVSFMESSREAASLSLRALLYSASRTSACRVWIWRV